MLNHTPQLRAAELHGEDEAPEPVQQLEQQEEISPVRDHPLAAGIRPGQRGRASGVARRNPHQPQHQAKRLRTELKGSSSADPACSSRALRELPLPARNSVTGESPARQRRAKQACTEAASPPEPAVDGNGAAELARGFGDLTHMRQYAVEASKALDRLKRKQRRTPAKGVKEAAGLGAAGITGGASTTRPRTPQEAAAQLAARATVEHNQQQRARSHSHNMPRSSRSGAAQPPTWHPAASDDDIAAATANQAAATPLQMDCDDLSSPALPVQCGSMHRASLVPESPAASLPELSGSQLQSPTSQQQWRLLSASIPARPATSDPSPLQQPHVACSTSPSPWRQRRRLSVGALSGDWLEDPLEEDEDDLLAADDFLAQSPLQQSDSEQEQDMTKERLFAMARSAGRVQRACNSSLGLAGMDDIGLTGMRLLKD
jgi:hypothetical protein